MALGLRRRRNSPGFHNSQKALATLGKAIDLAHRARAAADLARSGAAGGRPVEVQAYAVWGDN